MTKKKLLPFSLMPGSWGLKGKTREIAKAEYELEGYELDIELLRINMDEYEPNEYCKKKIDIDFKYGKINKIEQLTQLADLIENEDQRNLALLEIGYKNGKITDTEYAKQSATLKGEPWVTVISMDFGGNKSMEGSFELDWNDKFVENLKAEGYQGPTPDAIVNQWFMEVCKNVAMEEFDGTGNFAADADANIETMKRWNSTQADLPPNRRGYS